VPKYKRGAGSVYLKRGWCYIHYYVEGRSVTEAKRTKDKAEARRILRSRQGEIADGRCVGPASDKVMFHDLAEGVISDYRANGR